MTADPRPDFDEDEPERLQEPCRGCVYEHEGCPMPSDDHPASGPCGDPFMHGCKCVGIRQGIFSEFACESCYLEGK